MHEGGRRGGTPSRRSADAAAVHTVAWLRVGAAIGVAAAGSFQHQRGSSTGRVFVLLGLLWVPWSCLVLFAADRPEHPLARIGGPTGDVVALFVMQVTLPHTEQPVLLGYLLVLAFTAYTGGRRIAGVLSLAVLALAQLGHALGPHDDGISARGLLAFSVALVALVALLDRTFTLQLAAAERTELLRSQAEAVLARVADAVVVTDARSHIVQWNPAAERLIGRTGAELAGASCAAALGLHRGERGFDCDQGCRLLELAKRTDAQLGEELWRLDQVGRRQPVLANVSAVLDADERVVEVVHSLRDITRIKQAEEAKTLFLATASHELKTPLTVINGYAETLLRRNQLDPERTAVALESISRRGRELARIVDRLLLSSRIESGRAEVRITELAIAPVVAERVEALRDSTGRTIRYQTDDEVAEALGNEEAVATVVDHLVDNAIKYSPGGAPVEVTLRSDPEHVHVEVSDRGIGMDEEQMQSCFDKFWQAESTDVRRFGGTGIGLYIVRSLVEAMGGEVLVRSEKHAGTTFTMVLDRVPDTPPQPDAGQGEATSIREFMRQIGVPERET